MKIEIDVSVEEIQTALQKQVAESVARQLSGYESRDYITAQIKVQWRAATDDAIRDAMADSPAIKTAVRQELEKKLKAQISKLMKAENE